MWEIYGTPLSAKENNQNNIYMSSLTPSTHLKTFPWNMFPSRMHWASPIPKRAEAQSYGKETDNSSGKTL